MAGCAIRYWELATTLSKTCEVVLLAPNGHESFAAPFTIRKNSLRQLYKESKGATAILAQEIRPEIAFIAKARGVKLILDAYDPMVLEHLEIFKDFAPRYRNYKHEVITQSQVFSFRMADFVICANDRQRDLWMGMMMGLDRIEPSQYSADCTLSNLIDTVSFGLSSKPPQKTGPGIREKYNLKATDKVLLWGGGIWNWFDPLTLIQALYLILKTRSDMYLVFMGLKHPNPAVPEMQMSRDAIELATNLGLIGKHVFFNFGWTPYEERQNFLLDADIGLSIHHYHLETRFSFRTRLLDYIWAELPIISSEGDYFAELVKAKGLGEVVECGSVPELAHAILSIINSKERTAEIKQRLRELKPLFYWEKVAEPIEKALNSFSAMSKKIPLRMKWAMLRAFFRTKGPEKVIKKLLSLIGRKPKRKPLKLDL